MVNELERSTILDLATVKQAENSPFLLGRFAGDAYFYRHEIGSPKRRCTPGLRAYQWMMEVDRKSRIYNQQRLHALSLERSKDVRLFCSHDAVEFQAFTKEPNK